MQGSIELKARFFFCKSALGTACSEGPLPAQTGPQKRSNGCAAGYPTGHPLMID
tara:strand:- start:179 stop:340 length:162 start_codon:yes stop_codon:yes gene_type:complete